MGKIRLLPDHVASQVAAGEVVERPASIVKELIENSRDAGATQVIVDFRAGGRRLIRVTDNGCGMDRSDALMALERHGTSKLGSIDDLVRLRTMGFRGEALPSIASVSRFELLTREAASDSGTRVCVEGGKVLEVKEDGAPVGTRVHVADLFFNVPARRKFLKGEATETAHILQVLYGFALAFPEIGMVCRKDDAEQWRLSGTPHLAQRIRDLLGREFFDRLVAIEEVERDGMRLSGFVGRPGEGRRDRQQQFLILNGRPIQSPDISMPLREALHGVIPSGTHPIGILCLEIDPAAVDCNVHPAKREVRFARSESVRSMVFDAISATFVPARPGVPAVGVNRPPAFRSDVTPELSPHPTPHVDSPASGSDARPAPSAHDAPPLRTPDEIDTRDAAVPADPEQRSAAVRPDGIPFRPVAPIGEYYYALEAEDGLVLLDVRSASERIAFEKMLRRIEAGEAPSQRLLIPVLAELPPHEHAWVIENRQELFRAGFAVEPFGGLSVKIDGVPAAAGETDAVRLLHEIANSVRSAGKLPRGQGLLNSIAQAVCRSAPARQPVSTDEARRLVLGLLECEMPYADPAGRPTLIQFSFSELERKFGRTPAS